MEQSKIDKYLNKPNECPYCGSGEIEAVIHDWDIKEAVAYIECPDCKKEWKEIYTLTTIEETEKLIEE